MRCQRLMYAGGFMSPMQRCFSDLQVCQPLVTSYVIDAYLCFGRVACLDPRVPPHDALHLIVDTYEGRKASWRRPPGRSLNVWLNKIQEDTNALLLSTLWKSEIAMGHGAAQRSLGIRDDDDAWGWWWWRLVSKMEGKTNFSRHLQAVEKLDCWMFENHWRRV